MIPLKVDESSLIKNITIKLYRLDKLQAYFEKMALEGWEIREINQNECVFGKIEPKKIKYSVVYFKKSNKTGKEEAAFINNCDKLGWKLVDRYKNVYVLKAETDFPMTIPVNNKEQRREIILEYILQNLWEWIFVPALAILNLYEFGFTEVLVNYAHLIIAVLMVAPVIVAVIDLLNFILWCILAGSWFYSSGQPRRTPNLDRYAKLKTASLFFVLGMLIFSAVYEYNFSPESTEISRDQLPIALETIGIYPGDESERKSTYKKSATFLAEVEVYSDSSEKKESNKAPVYHSIDYSIFKNDSPFLIDFYVYAHTHKWFDTDYEAGNADEWGAKAVYTATDRAKTIVVYDDTVFIYKFTADSEDIAAMRKALGR